MTNATRLVLRGAMALTLWVSFCSGFVNLRRFPPPFAVVGGASSSSVRGTITSETDSSGTTSATTSTSAGTIVINDDADFIKPEPDKRKYRAVKLENGLEALLVSSPDSDSEAGCE